MNKHINQNISNSRQSRKQKRRQNRQIRQQNRKHKRQHNKKGIPFLINEYTKLDQLRFTTAGSVDDGKSTLIGRLLYDSNAIFQDQLNDLEQVRKRKNKEQIDLALLTDGLRAEREQGITIDVAYRYFATKKRKFIIADTPGHEQYTRNMVTGASTANLAIILIDARKGVLTQSKRHGFIASLLGIPHLLVAINKMDLVNWSEDIYNTIVDEYTRFSEKLSIRDIRFIPISALHGDNVVRNSLKAKWYEGPSVMQYLESITIVADGDLRNFRFPVQFVIRPHQDFRGFAGRIESGTISLGEEIIALPSGNKARVQNIFEYKTELEEAFQGQSVLITLDREIDISRGDMLVRSQNIPVQSNKFEAIICWMDDCQEMIIGNQYLMQHTTRTYLVKLQKLNFRINVNTLHREQSSSLRLNEIGRVEIELSMPFYFDSYNDNRKTGSFILIDPNSNTTVAAGMIRHEIRVTRSIPQERNLSTEKPAITLEKRIQRNKHRPLVLWFTGLSGSGKTTLARGLEQRIFNEGKQVCLLDGDNLRQGLNSDLDFSETGRSENIRRAAEVAKILYLQGNIVLCAFISPKESMRTAVRNLFPHGDFFEIQVRVSLATAEQRDVKGLYKRVALGEISNFTGIHQQYEEGNSADLVVNSEIQSIEESLEKIMKFIIEQD